MGKILRRSTFFLAIVAIVLAVKILAQTAGNGILSPQQFSAAASDTMFYPSGSLLGSDATPPTSAGNWTALYGLSECQNVGGNSEPNALSTSCGQSWTGTAAANDQTSSVVLGNFTFIGVGYVNIIVRASPSAKTYYDVELNGGSIYAYRWVNGSPVQMASVADSWASGDRWSLSAAGSCFTIWKNGSMVSRFSDYSITGGTPGYLQYATGALSDSKVSQWQGYNFSQQDGIWTKQGVTIPMESSDADASFDGVSNPSRILYEANAQILSGTVYKVLFGCAQNTCYAESSTGGLGSWSRYATPILTGQGFPQVIENAGTEYLFTEAPLGATGINEYTCTNWVSCSSVATNIITPGAGGSWDAASVYYFTPVYISGATLYAIYTGGNAAGHYATGYATCTGANFSTCTKYGSNPVASNWWGALPMKAGNTWYGWGQTNQPGRGGNFLDPTDSMRMQSTDLITWTNGVHSIHNSEPTEGVNTTTGQAIANTIIDIGGVANLLYGCSPQDASAPQIYQICLATAPRTWESIPPDAESATQMVGWDYFNRANENPLSNGGHWTTAHAYDATQIVSGVSEPSVAGSPYAGEVFTGASFSNDQYASITLGTLASDGTASVGVRASASAKTFYEVTINGPTGSSGGGGAIYCFIAGSPSLIGPSSVSLTPQVGDVFTLSVVGNVINLYQNGALISSQVDYLNRITSGYPAYVQGVSGASVASSKVTAFTAGNANVTIK